MTLNTNPRNEACLITQTGMAVGFDCCSPPLHHSAIVNSAIPSLCSTVTLQKRIHLTACHHHSRPCISAAVLRLLLLHPLLPPQTLQNWEKVPWWQYSKFIPRNNKQQHVQNGSIQLSNVQAHVAHAPGSLCTGAQHDELPTPWIRPHGRLFSTAHCSGLLLPSVRRKHARHARHSND